MSRELRRVNAKVSARVDYSLLWRNPFAAWSSGFAVSGLDWRAFQSVRLRVFMMIETKPIHRERIVICEMMRLRIWLPANFAWFPFQRPLFNRHCDGATGSKRFFVPELVNALPGNPSAGLNFVFVPSRFRFP